MAMESFPGIVDCYYGPYKWMSSFSQLVWQPPKMFLTEADSSFPSVFTDGGKRGASMVMFPPGTSECPLAVTLFHEVQRSAQIKELYAVVLALSEIQGPLNLFSDSIYIVNLLPNLVGAHIRLDDNPITPLMIQARNLLKQRLVPLFVQHLMGHQDFPSFLSRGHCSC